MYQIIVLLYNMKHKEIQTPRLQHLAASFDQLCDKDQLYLETLAAQLAKIHETAPEKQISTGKKPGNKVQLNKE
jgi:hypothetical protein